MMGRNLSVSQNANARKYWFVVHTHKLWDINDRILGFWNQLQWCQISVGDYIIYYRSQCYKQVKGLFEVIGKDKDIDMNFSMQTVQGKHPEYQLSLLDLNRIPKINRIVNMNNLSFHTQWVASKGHVKKCLQIRFMRSSTSPVYAAFFSAPRCSSISNGLM